MYGSIEAIAVFEAINYNSQVFERRKKKVPGIINVENFLDPAYVTGPSGEDWTVQYLLSRRNVQPGWESLTPKGYLRRGPSLATAGIKLPRGGRRQNSLIGGRGFRTQGNCAHSRAQTLR